MYCTTTLGRIIALSEAEQQLLSKCDYLTDDEQRAFAEIRASLAQLWPQRRAELVMQRHGPPRMISAPDPSRRAQVRRFVAHGIAPLPSGGD